MDNEEGGKIIRKDRVGVEKVMGYKIQLWEIVLVVNMKVYWKRFHPCEVGGTGPLIIKWKVKERGEIDTCCLYNSLQKYMAFIKNVLIWRNGGRGRLVHIYHEVRKSVEVFILSVRVCNIENNSFVWRFCYLEKNHQIEIQCCWCRLRGIWINDSKWWLDNFSGAVVSGWLSKLRI